MNFRGAIAASVALALVVAGLGVALIVIHLTSLTQARFWVGHTHQVIDATQSLFGLVQDAESGERGYLLTEDARDLALCQDAIRDIAPAEQRLLTLVTDNPDQSARVRDLNRMIDLRKVAIGHVVAAARGGDLAAARTMAGQAQGAASLADIRRQVVAIRAVENANLRHRVAETDRQERILLGVGMALSLLALCGLTVGAVLLARANRRLSEAIAQAQSAQTAREASDTLSRAIFANSPDYLIVVNVEPDGGFTLADINPAFAQVLGVAAARLRGRSVADLLPEPPRESVLALYRRVRAAGGPVTDRDEVPFPGGPRVWETVLTPVANSEGVVERIIGSVRDITDRERSAARLRDSQRMEAVGQLTGGVAHDFNNLLQVIHGNLELLQPAVEDNPRAAQRLKNALHGADRAAQLTRQLLAFARRQPLAPQVINLSRLVSDMAELLRRTLGEAIEVETVLAGGLWNTIADPAQVESALLNLALNARDAMPEGGRLTVEITNAVLDDAYARRTGEVTPGQYVLLAVTDTGEGMSEETKARVFEPFFTTKSDGKGTGLGLSMVYGFVKQSHGHVQLYSELGHGTTVKIYLPRSFDAEKAPAPRAADEFTDGEQRLILVVEDEPAVRAAAVATLQDLGYRCLEAADAEAALALVEAEASIDLVFSDVVMPGAIRTREFAARLREMRPDLPILFTSGYTENAIVHQGRLDEGVSLISKPYAKDDLARRLAGLLAA